MASMRLGQEVSIRVPGVEGLLPGRIVHIHRQGEGFATVYTVKVLDDRRYSVGPGKEYMVLDGSIFTEPPNE